MLCRLNGLAIVLAAALSLGCARTTERSDQESVGGADGGRESGTSLPAGSSTVGGDANGGGDSSSVPVAGGAGGGGASGADPSSYVRVFRSAPLPPIEPCSANADCDEGKVCFRLADELGVCDSPAVLESNQCNTNAAYVDPDECGCSGGGGAGGGTSTTCASGQVCRAVPWTCSCAPQSVNRCVEVACQSPDDCAAPSVCTPSSYILGASHPGRCLTPSCASDSDCNKGPAGRCSLLLQDPQQGGPVTLKAVTCVYQGASGCTEGEPTGLFYANVDVETYYQCL